MFEKIKCPECGKNLEYFPYRSGVDGLPQTTVMGCMNKKCKFYKIPRIFSHHDIEEAKK